MKLDEIDRPEQEQPDESWTKSNLQAWAYENGIDIKSRDTKQIILQKIREASARG